MSKVAISGNASGTGTFTIAAPNSNSDRTLTLPDDTGTVVYQNASGNVGIGTSSPTEKLDVLGNTDTTLRVRATSDTALILNETTPNKTWKVKSSDGGLYFQYSSTAYNSGFSSKVAIDSSGNVGVNNTSPAVLSSTTQVAVKANASADAMFVAQNSNGLTTAKFGFQFTGSVDNPVIGSYTNHPFLFLTNNTERMRILSGGQVNIGTGADTNAWFVVNGADNHAINTLRNGTGVSTHIAFRNGNGQVGNINTSGTSTSYNTSSDYRLKENIAPMTGALATVAQLNPVTYTWKTDGSAGQGFIAHELQAVVPDCVTGEKDAVETYLDEEGVEQTRPVYQGIDTSFLVATLTAAIKELSSKNDALEARIAALEGAANVTA